MANFDAAKAIFTQADANHDGGIDLNEFRHWVAGGGGSDGGASGGLNSSSYEESSFQSSNGGLGASAGYAVGGGAGSSGYESAGGYGAGGYGAGGYGASGYGASGYGASGYGANSATFSSQSGYESDGSLSAAGGYGNAYSASSNSLYQGSGGAAVQSSGEQQIGGYSATGGLFNDPNPQIIRRAAAGGAVTYQQKISVRFLQPPPIPPPGPLIIKEVRPPQPPPPPPLVVRQCAQPFPQLPPLVLRERPPVLPSSVASQTVVRQLAPLPVPPRSVIIERLPPLPPKPRDIIIERWVPYGAQAKRRTIVQRAAAAQQYVKPRNIVIVYEAVQARVVRQFQRLGVTQESPQAYFARYGASLLDAGTLLQQARSAGVVEDISPPGLAASAQFSSSAYGVGGGGGAGAAGFDLSNASSSQNFSSFGGASGFEGLQVVGGAEAGTYGLDVAEGGAGGGYSSQSYSSSSNYGSEGGFAGGAGGAGGAGFDVASASFVAADSNHDGNLDQGEFQRFIQGGLQ